MFVEGTINEIPPPETDAPVDPDATTIVETINEIPPPEIDAPVDPDATTNEGADKAASPDADAKDATH